MARIRSIHPGLFTDEAFVTCSPMARLLVMGIWTECDDNGVFEWKPVGMKMRLLPADPADVAALLAELVANKLVVKETWDGRDYGLVRNFCIYQRPKRPSIRYQIPDTFRTYVGLNADGSRKNPQASPTCTPDSTPTAPTQGESHPQMERRGEESSRREEESNHIDKPVVVVVPREPEKPESTTTTTKFLEGIGLQRMPLEASNNPLGTALAETWVPDEGCIDVAHAQGMTDADIDGEVMKFHALNTQRAAFSQNWNSTWTLWCAEWKRRATAAAAKAVPPRVEVSSAVKFTTEMWNSAAKTWAREQRWSRQLGNEPGMSGCKCPEIILTAHGIDPATGMVKAVAS